MKNLYLIDTATGPAVVTYDPETRIIMYLDLDRSDVEPAAIRNEYGEIIFDLATVEDDSSWERYEDYDSLEDFLGIENWDCHNSERYRLLDEIENWED